MNKTRSALLLSLVSGVTLALACGGGTTSNSTGSSDGGPGSSGGSSSGSSGTSSSGTSSGASSSEDGGIPCGTTTCAASQSCCITGLTGMTCADSCPDGSIAESCTGPSQCSSGTVCCGGVMSGSSCVSSCPAGTQQLCATDSDCPSGDTCYNYLAMFGGGAGGGLLGSLFGNVSIPSVCINPEAGYPGYDGSFPSYDGGRYNRGDGSAPPSEAGGDDGSTAAEASTTADGAGE